jgi:hypothetical protein
MPCAPQGVKGLEERRKDCNAFIEGQSVQEHCDTLKVKAPRYLKMPITLRPRTQKT